MGSRAALTTFYSARDAEIGVSHALKQREQDA